MFRQFLIPGFMLLLSSFALTSCIETAVGLGTAAVAASTTEKGFSTSVSDTVIKGKLTDKFIKNDVSLVTGVESSVSNGAVLMTGKLDSQDQKILATRLAWEIKGVKEVINEIQLVSDKSVKTTAKDLAASAQLRAALIGDQEISSLNYSIDVVNGIVYLSGVAENEKERERVIMHAQTLRFAKKVVNYIILSTDKRD
jgi:osmotically-inducible protein OsmY